MKLRPLQPGDPVPWFALPTHQSPAYRIDTAAGRTVVLLAFGSTGPATVTSALEAILARAGEIKAPRLMWAGLVADAGDALARRFSEALVAPVFVDRDLAVATTLGVAGKTAEGRGVFAPTAFVLDRRLRVWAAVPLDDPATFVDRIAAEVAAVDEAQAEQDVTAPVLIVPRVLEPAFCQELIELYERTGGEQSGFMQTGPDGKTIYAFDPQHKKRRDLTIEDEAQKNRIRDGLRRRLVPEIKRAFQFEATRIERYIVACYSAEEGGHFRAHRDNTTKGTAHRRFAVSINLAADRHEGGDLRFPEYGERTYRPPSGGAVVFSCSVLHEATPVTAGVRYAVLPFLYDDAAARIRTENLKFIADKQMAEVAA